MYPRYDKDLDRLSREAAERYEVESGLLGWEHLEKRLDQELPKKNDRKRFLFWLFFIGLTAGGGLIAVLLNNSRPSISLAPKTVTVSKSAENSQVSTSNHQSTLGNNKSSISTDDLKTMQSLPVISNEEGNASMFKPGTAPKWVTEPETIQNGKSTQQSNVKAAQKVITKKNSIVKSDILNASIIREPRSLNNPVSTTPMHTNSNLKKSSKYKDSIAKIPGQASPDTSLNTIIVTRQDIKKTTAPKLTDSTATAASVVKKDNEALSKKDRTIKQPLELGLMMGPDATTVQFGPLYQLGINVGLYFGYRFSNRWSVNTSIIYTKKFYKADGEYYHGKIPWPGITIDEVKGNCSMLDIPINARYDVAFNRKRRFFVSIGLSTYLMNKENYNISYYYNNQYRQYPKNLDSNSNYIFSIINLSLGYERSLGKHFSIQTEPYLKIPMKGLGYGKMRMDSYGIFFSLKYKPAFHSKRVRKNEKATELEYIK